MDEIQLNRKTFLLLNFYRLRYFIPLIMSHLIVKAMITKFGPKSSCIDVVSLYCKFSKFGDILCAIATTGGNFQGIKFSRKAQKQDFHVYLFATPMNYTVHNLYNTHGVTNISNYTFTKQSLSTKFAKISSREKYHLYPMY